MPKTGKEREKFLRSLGLNPNAPALVADVKPSKKAKTSDASGSITPEIAKNMAQGAAEVDPHTIPVGDIVFDPALLDEFPDLARDCKAASEKVFAMYKGPRGSERNKLLHRRISEFISQVKRSRKTGGYVKDKIKATAEQRELAASLAELGITEEELLDMVKAHRG